MQQVEAQLALAARLSLPLDAPTVEIGGEVITDFDELVTAIGLMTDPDEGGTWAGRAAGGTVQAFLRRLDAAKPYIGQLIRGQASEDDAAHAIDTGRAQVTVVDIHRLHDRAQRFVVGVMLKREFERKEASGSPRPLMLVVLDELNKYAPREGRSPIKDVLLDIAERGRSLGVVLVGAQQTASEVEPRVVANCSYRVAGRLDAAEAQRGEYGFLTPAARARASLLKPGSMILAQPEIPVPLLLRFPHPGLGHAPVRGRRDYGPVREVRVRLLHTADWHVGRTMRGRSRVAEFEAVLAEVVDIARRERVEAMLVCGDTWDHHAPSAESDRLVFEALRECIGHGIQVVLLAGNHDNPRKLRALGLLSELLGVQTQWEVRRPNAGGVLTIEGREHVARIASVPFITEGRYVDAAAIMGLQEDWVSAYADGVAEILRASAATFEAGTVNILATHIFVDNARVARVDGSERKLHIGQTYGVTAASLPSTPQYIALGHVHEPQEHPRRARADGVQRFAAPARLRRARPAEGRADHRR